MQDSLYICSIITKQVIYGKDHCIFKSEGWCRQEYFVLSLCPLPRSKEPEVAVLDADLSHNIYNLRQRELAKVKDAVKPWEVWTLDAAASTDAS